ncbi:T9SS type A sorting domain-containing protein [Hymenobacter cheonanensis]|uniref:T9SS type A sorting domain-containing protein n=1 Tax=Hymenobacter sp. CA2-7 TaxID=3063993 RepID=UPI00271288E3|nr:T9SS type A sorting domain-containing protein [Hymenobacter sp. CA2-7]MDO7884346.1 T9SS type A sorting domain-containing protein [Hymenobacter sp. CA2-7]
MRFALLILLLFSFNSLAGRAQAPAWQQAVAAGATSGSYSSITACIADNQGNVYVAGSFAGTVSLGGTTLLNTTADGLRDVFIAKWSSSAQAFVWVQQAGGTGADVATAIALSGPNVYVAGWFTSRKASFGASVLRNADSTSLAGSRDIFVASLTDAGATSTFTGAQRAGGPADDYATGLAASGPSLYLAGGFAETASFGNISLASAGSTDAFVAALAPGGGSLDFAWAQRAGGPAEDYANGLASSGQAVYATGNFASATASFGPARLANANPDGSFDVFVAKLAAASGIFAWAQRAGGAGDDRANVVATDGASVYVAGEFQSTTAGFGPATLANAGTSGLYYDVFVTQLTDAGGAGSFSWARRAGGPGDDYGTALAVSSAGVYVAGAFGGNVPGTTTASFGNTQLTSANSLDIYVAKLTSAGGFAWAQRAGGLSLDRAGALAVGGASVYVGGDFLSTVAAFSSQTIRTPGGSITAFLAVLPDASALASPAASPLASLLVAPNPAHASTRVLWASAPGAAQASLTLTDALGRVVRTHTVALSPAGLACELPLGGIAPGLYLLRVQVGAATAVRRLAIN